MSARRTLTLVIVGALALGPSAAAEPAAHPATPQQIDFVEKKVRPILVEHCHKCHGAKKRMGGLRLDVGAALLKGGDSGPALVPGNADASLLVKAVRRQGELQMPPREALPADAVAALAAWVQMGAPWPEARPSAAEDAWKRHWAFQPIADPAVPAVKLAAWPKTPVDRFILARLEAKGLGPAPPTDRCTLIRRVSFDLIGLPPTPEEIANFEADHTEEAFARVLDRLLASPHYGERWARHWLDVARYADTRGYVFFQDANYPWSYTYRDYVVRAFNEDLPYNRFLLHQLAADRLPLGEDCRPLAALGFLTLGGRFMNNVHDILDDQIDVVTRGLMGLTVSCARCHDHKFDPIPQADYYALYGVFASSTEPEVPPLFEPTPRTTDFECFQDGLAFHERNLEDYRSHQFDAIIAGAKARVGEYLMAVHALANQPNQDEFMLLADGGDLNPTMLKSWRAYVLRTGKAHHPVFASWHALCALPEKDFAARCRELVQQWTQRPAPGRPLNPLVVQALVSKPPAKLAEAAQRYSELLNETERLWQEALRQASAAKRPAPVALPDPAREQLRLVFHAGDAPPAVPRSLLNDLTLFPDRPSQATLQELRKAVEQWRVNEVGAPPRAHALIDLPAPIEPRIFLRGNPNQPGPVVPRRAPAIVAGPKRQAFHDGSGRLELAKTIIDPNNPLTDRVFVNRVWMHHFGQGLVRTPVDFGLRSDPPSHPKLLDHLAAAFIKSGWSVKELHRMILLSATYQQSCTSNSKANPRAADPENSLLWRMNRRRLDFEATRDALLAVAGRLDRTVGGPPVHGILGPNAARRTLYGFVDRQTLPGLYRAFDFPSPDATSAQRDATTIPQQALYLMNNLFVLECARGLLRQPDVAAAKDLAARVDRLYRLCYGRPPSVDDLALAQEYLGPAPDWERYAQALLEANEFVFVD
jgi:hypothetical protein